MKCTGSESCDISVRRLINRAARNIFADGTLKVTENKYTVSLPATSSSLPEYYNLERFADREEYHGRLQIYITLGAIEAVWDLGAGENGQLKRISLLNPIAASNLLCERLPWEITLQAIDDLNSTGKSSLPRVDHIINGWKHGKSPSGISPDNSRQLIDSLKVIDASQNASKAGKDILLRRLSVQLFNDSKRIESLSHILSFLLEIEKEDVFSNLGLVKHPQPMLISSSSSCQVLVSGILYPLAFPYSGFRPDTIEGVIKAGCKIKQILTIENLASFNEASEDKEKPENLLIIYLAGNPTPSFLEAYKRILETSHPEKISHWGDIDVGGYRIAARLDDYIKPLGYRLSLWKMNPQEVALEQQETVPTRKQKDAILICKKHEWLNESEGLINNPVFKEQEFIEWEAPEIKGNI
ncbi:Wadjet anti-phage system protein JetD domain-containing protein [Vibrio cholerae]|uniref:Wadjet anti-phage system protein JetD domain-containing protein n=1 Tax=Vibrio cholerae TaxID=666 RepID=UPI002D1F3F4E|nr:Wadjet anti-phage system protein JetD domain-containing protein [Vibrio cholerae]MEB3763419.1 hypothetical protein [Vibrio cholerae]